MGRPSWRQDTSTTSRGSRWRAIGCCSYRAQRRPAVDLSTLTRTPDFQDAALNVNVVFRWEYTLGSTLYLVYAHSQIPKVATFTAPARLDPNAFGHGGSSDVILLKFSYWWAG